MIDLRSDTITKPTEDMRRAMYEAEVGDDVFGEDPTVKNLETKAADILGKEDALFVTSGTQGNQIAVLTHCQPGNEIILEEDAHIFYYEGGAIAAFAGVQTRTIKGDRGMISPALLKKAVRGDDIHFPETGLICMENTHNRAGGAIVPIDHMRDVYQVASEHHVPLHLDGARLFNAAAELERPISEFTEHTTTVQICLSKGLGAPAGSIIAGDQAFIKRARKWRKRLGGGLRQVGVLAAPGLIAMTDMATRLKEDHIRARKLADGLRTLKDLQVVNQVDTNIVVVETNNSNKSVEVWLNELKDKGILAVPFGPTTIRLTTHHHITDSDIESTLAAFNQIV
ncbi:threonine aldolase family protein [Pseudalkalibacillus berkeleyi]|uniref:Aminotransferase class I/II-fold pyridoxal phosphate-dependent enzyme n=1 Tax=Pseudalkalibacillus berkeleyi TaxID=1069813 RepID=A0ABS9H0F1_9BACL|nr:GntG family PLP-dependent aldolase [Pseudalkalibacillus berkeleyi]MCF6137315.1 aminotransferase class I/II-fold pyridoxal phosphate-dependent enzyme [Pseudalkalibacillus berkeleyi]